MIRTRVGYAGGTTSNPDYNNIGDHTETIQIDYDPDQISYEELLETFWKGHNPALEPYSRQYASVIFYHNEEQKNLALASMQEVEAESGQKVLTEIIPFSQFYLAEDYHQKYYLQQEAALFDEFQAKYPDFRQLIDSTAAARVNGYIGGWGTIERLREQLDSFGLSDLGNERMMQIGSYCLWRTEE